MAAQNWNWSLNLTFASSLAMRCRLVGWDPFDFLASLHITLYQLFCDLAIEDYWFIMYTRGAILVIVLVVQIFVPFSRISLCFWPSFGWRLGAVAGSWCQISFHFASAICEFIVLDLEVHVCHHLVGKFAVSRFECAFCWKPNVLTFDRYCLGQKCWFFDRIWNIASLALPTSRMSLLSR